MKTASVPVVSPFVHWKKEEKEPVYTANDVINAWLQGHKEGAEEERRILIQRFEQNLQHACDISTRVIRKLKEKGITCKFAVLGADGISDFKSLMFIDSQKYESLDNLRLVYAQAREVIEPNINDDFYLAHSVLPLDKANLNQKRILADGYFMQYGEL